jgi:carboxylate-amine ligase
VPERDLILEYLSFVDSELDELGSRKAIEYIHTMLERGSGADRQLQVFRETGDLRKVVDYMAAETKAGL